MTNKGNDQWRRGRPRLSGFSFRLRQGSDNGEHRGENPAATEEGRLCLTKTQRRPESGLRLLIRQSRRSRAGESALSMPGSPRTTSLRSLTSPWGRPLPSLSFFSFTLNSARFAHATKHADFFFNPESTVDPSPTSSAWVPVPISLRGRASPLLLGLRVPGSSPPLLHHAL